MGTRNMIVPDAPLDVPDPQAEKEAAERRHLGTPEKYTGFEKEESRSEPSVKGMNSQSPQQPPETEGDTRRDFARTVRAHRTPTDDIDREENPYY